MKFNLKELKILALVSDECYNYERKHNKRLKGFTYQDLMRISKYKKPSIQYFLKKCRSVKLIHDEKLEIKNNKALMTFYFDSNVLDDFIWVQNCPELLGSANSWIEDHSVLGFKRLPKIETINS